MITFPNRHEIRTCWKGSWSFLPVPKALKWNVDSLFNHSFLHLIKAILMKTQCNDPPCCVPRAIWSWEGTKTYLLSVIPNFWSITASFFVLHRRRAATGNGGFTDAIFVYSGICLPWALNHYISKSSNVYLQRGTFSFSWYQNTIKFGSNSLRNRNA